MLKKVPINLLFALVIVLVALFAATEVIAQDCPYSTTITVPKGTITITAVGRDLQPITAGDKFPFSSTENDSDFPCPYENCDVSVYLFTDDHDQDLAIKSIAHFFACYPRCCGGEFHEIYGDPHGPIPPDHISPPYDPDHRWPTVYTCYTVQMTPDTASTGRIIVVYTSPGESRVMDVAVKVGSKVYHANEGIIGADCGDPEDPHRIDIKTQCFEFVDSTWFIEWTDPRNVCPTVVHAAPADTSCEDCKLTDPIEGEPLDTIVDTETNKNLVFLGTTNTECDMAWIRFIDSSGSNRKCFTSGGKRYCY